MLWTDPMTEGNTVYWKAGILALALVEVGKSLRKAEQKK
jgi:hypothetical protein